MPATPPEELLQASACFSCLGVSVSDSLTLALWDLISQNTPVASFIARAGITDQTQIDAVTALHSAAVDHGWWDKCDLIYPFVGGTAQAHAQNLRSAQFTITWNGTVTHDANGITGDGATGYGDTGYAPASSSILTLDNAHAGYYRRNEGAAGRSYLGVNNSMQVFRPPFPPNALGCFVNSAAGSAVSAALALLVSTRIDATNTHLYVGGVDNSNAAAASGITALLIFVLAANVAGAPGLFSTVNCAAATVGSGITFAEYGVMASDFQTFNTALGRQV